MNRLILKYGYPITVAILAVLAWVTYRIFTTGGSDHATFIVVAVLVWGIGTFLFLYLWPMMTYSAFKRAIVRYGFDGSPIPINTMYAVPRLASPAEPNSSLLGTGTDNLLYIGGWLDLAKGPLVLHVPDMGDRYYSVQFTDPSDGTNFAYVGKRTTGTEVGDYLVCGPGWQGKVAQGMSQIISPHHSVLVMGRVLVESDSDLATAYALAKQIQLTPLPQWQPKH